MEGGEKRKGGEFWENGADGRSGEERARRKEESSG